MAAPDYFERLRAYTQEHRHAYVVPEWWFLRDDHKEQAQRDEADRDPFTCYARTLTAREWMAISSELDADPNDPQVWAMVCHRKLEDEAGNPLFPDTPTTSYQQWLSLVGSGVVVRIGQAISGLFSAGN